MQTPGDKFLTLMTRFSAALIALCFFAMMALLIHLGGPSLWHFGFPFLTSSQWSPSQNQFGAFSAILGTLTTSFIAIIITAPLAFLTALAIEELLPCAIKKPISRLIELMAAIPSIIYGIWGLFILGPALANHVYPFLIQSFADIPILNYVFGGMPIPMTIMTGALILSLMIFPYMTATMRDILASMPPLLIEASYGSGLTRWQVVRHISFHYTRAGLLGASILGLSRALGETMAVTFVIGNSHQLPPGLIMPGTTISAAIANEFTEAMSPLYQSSLVALGVILMGISLITLWISRRILNHSQVRGGSQ